MIVLDDWTDKVDGVDDILAQHVNSLAAAIIAAAAKIPEKAIESQAIEGTNDTEFMTPLMGKKQFDHFISASLVNTPEIYTKETIEGMNTITGMKHGDMCIILSGNTSAQSIYRYYTKDINGNALSTPQWVWLTDLSLFAPQPVQELTMEITDDGLNKLTWDYSKGNTAKTSESYINLFYIVKFP